MQAAACRVWWKSCTSSPSFWLVQPTEASLASEFWWWNKLVPSGKTRKENDYWILLQDPKAGWRVGCKTVWGNYTSNREGQSVNRSSPNYPNLKWVHPVNYSKHHSSDHNKFDPPLFKYSAVIINTPVLPGAAGNNRSSLLLQSKRLLQKSRAW